MTDSQTVQDPGVVAPIGAISADSPATDSSGAPEPVKLTADSLIQFDGSDKPVKFSEYGRGFQSKFTQASQELARVKQALQERDQRLAQFEQERNRSQQVQPGTQPDPLAELETVPYVTGQEAASIVRSLSEQVKSRDQYLMAAFKEIKALKDIVGGLHESATNSGFNAKIDKWVTDAGYDQQARNIAQEIYLAYEGNDLDREFPRIFSERMKELEAYFESRKRAQVEAARNRPFVPGRGGSTGPNSPLKLAPNATPAQIADALWVNRSGGDTT